MSRPSLEEGASLSEAEASEHSTGCEEGKSLGGEQKRGPQTGRLWRLRAADTGPGQQYEKEAASLFPLPRRPQVWRGPQREVDCDTPPPSHQPWEEPECWDPGMITGAVNPAGGAQGSVLGPSFLKQPHPSGHRLELGPVHHLKTEAEHGSWAYDPPPSGPGPSSLLGPGPKGQHLCPGGT